MIFKSFCTVRTQAEGRRCGLIYSLDITKQDDMITIRISGSASSIIWCALIAGNNRPEVGIEAYPPEHMEDSGCQGTARPQGVQLRQG